MRRPTQLANTRRICANGGGHAKSGTLSQDRKILPVHRAEGAPQYALIRAFSAMRFQNHSFLGVAQASYDRRYWRGPIGSHAQIIRFSGNEN
jgi:hypothetical protein